MSLKIQDIRGDLIQLELAVEYQITQYPDNRWRIYYFCQYGLTHEIPIVFKNQFAALSWLSEQLLQSA